MNPSERLKRTQAVADTPSFLFYDDEDKILPLLLHGADSRGLECGCRDCLALRVRMRQIELLQSKTRSELTQDAA